jgi:hypothetical protein
MGKSFMEQLIYQNGMDGLELPQESRFEEGEVKRFYESTFIRTKTDNSVIFAREMFRGQLLRNTDKFTDILKSILDINAKPKANIKYVKPLV